MRDTEDGVPRIDRGPWEARFAAVATADFPPLWPAVLAAAHRLGLGTRTGYQLVGVVLGSATIALARFLGRRGAGPRVGLITALIAACCPMLIAANRSVMSESLYVLVVTATLLSCYWASLTTV